MTFEEVRPDAKNNWLNLLKNDFEELLPLASKQAKLATKASQERAIFKLHSLGVVTNRDEWVYADSRDELLAKVKHFVRVYEGERERWAHTKKRGAVGDFVSREIKWTSELEDHLVRGTKLAVSEQLCRQAMYRPFIKLWTYYSEAITHRLYQQDSIFPIHQAWENVVIVYTQPGSQKPFMACAVSALPDLHFVGAAAGTECLPFYHYDEAGNRVDNVTDWALEQFRKHYQPGRGKKARPITKEAIFQYVYAVLHDPLYREKYELNLKREFPRIPLYGDSESVFWQWSSWGAALMALHLNYESAEPFPLPRTDVPDANARTAGQSPKCVLKSELNGGATSGRIIIDSETTLAGIPANAWTYQLGNRSALDWVLDQYKEKKPKDLTIREKFDTYRFADHKEQMIDLLRRVTTVSVKTMQIIAEMTNSNR